MAVGIIISAGRRLAGWSAVLVAVLLGAALLVAPTARAGSFDNGTITLGTQVTLTSAGWDVHVYHLTLPADQRLVVTTGPSGTPTEGNLYIVDDATGARVAVGTVGNTVAVTGAPIELAPATTDRQLQLQFDIHGAGELPFTTQAKADVPTQPIAWDTPTTVTLDAYQQARLTFDGVAGERLAVSVTGSTFPASGLSLGVETRHPFSGQMYLEYTFGPTEPGRLMTSAPYRLLLDGAGAASGSVTVTVRHQPDITGTITMGQNTTVSLDQVWNQVRQTLALVPGERLTFELIGSTLQHADGTPGTAQATLIQPGGYGVVRSPLGTITTTPRTVPFEGVMGTGTATLEIVPDGASTGTITYRFSSRADNPPVAATVGVPIAVAFDTIYQTRRYTIDAQAGQRFTLAVSQLALTATAPANARLVVTVTDSATGEQKVSTELSADQPSYSTLITTAGPTTFTVLLDPYADSTGSATLTITPIEDAAVALTSGQVTTGAVPASGGDLVFTYGGSTTPGLPAITVEGSTLVDSGGARISASMTFEQPGVLYSGSHYDWVGVTDRYSFRAPADLDPSQPWRLRVSAPAGTTGTLSLSLRPPTLTQRTIKAGTTARVSFEGVADTTELTFVPQTGKRIVVQLSGATVQAGYVVRTQDGAELTPIDENQFAAPTTTAPLVFVFSQRETGAAGGLDVVVRQVSDPVTRARGATTVRWAVGQNPRMTFDGEKGRRVTLALEAGAWDPADRPVNIALLDSRGRKLGDLTSYYGGNEFTSNDIRLPADGRYMLDFDPSGPTAGSLVATVKTVQDIQRAVSLPSTTQLSFTQAGQRAYLSVKVPAGKHIAWSTPNFSVVGTMALLDSAGNPVGFAYLGGVDLGGTLSFDPLPAGTYTVVVYPASPPTGRMWLTLKAI